MSSSSISTLISMGIGAAIGSAMCYYWLHIPMTSIIPGFSIAFALTLLLYSFLGWL